MSTDTLCDRYRSWFDYEAGFKGVEVLPIEDLFFRIYQLIP